MNCRLERFVAAGFVGFLALASSAVTEEQGANFVELKDGAEVVSPVKVVMGVEGMKIKPSGDVAAGTGRPNILINRASWAGKR